MRPLLIAAALAAMTQAQADLKVSHVFSSNMVLQQKTTAPIWGWATPGAKVTLEVGWTNKSWNGTAGKDGRWQIDLPTPAADNKPYDLMIKSGDDFVALHNVVMGEVWIASGQSNMEWPMELVTAPGDMIMTDYPMIRHLKVQRNNAPNPVSDIAGSWEVCDPNTTKQFTAVGYHFALRLHQELKVPVGIVNTTWGGTEAELWTSREKLASLPEISEGLVRREREAAAYPALWKSYQTQQMLIDKGYGNWMNLDKDDSDWTPITNGFWTQNPLGDFKGVAWYRGTFEAAADGEASIATEGIDDIDETWLNGDLIGSTDGWDTPRRYKGHVRKGKNVLTIRITNPYGEGGFDFSKVSISGVSGIKWVMKKGPAQSELPAAPQSSSGASGLYNGMIHPLLPLAFKGAIWYQGESNVGRARQYETLFPAMITDWRERWGRVFPFYWVQIAPYAYNSDMASAELRDAQRLSLSLPKTGMALAADAVDDFRDIHPKNKRVPAGRLALHALKNEYGQKGIVASGPLPTKSWGSGQQFFVQFAHGEGMHSKSGTLGGFQIAGEDGVFYPAAAVVQGDKVMLVSGRVSKPVAARYAWADAFPAVDQMLFNKAGLPASSFRTDKFRMQTQDVKW